MLIIAVSLVSGCRILNLAGGDDSAGVAGSSTISGKVFKSSLPVATQRDSSRPALVAADQAGATGIAGAEVLLEGLASDPRYQKTTDASGTYRFTDVPPGEHWVIVKYNDPATGKTMKARSAGLQVTDIPTLVEAPDLAVEPALNVVTGQLRDAEGNFLPEGTVLTVWGEPFIVGRDGTFTSPALPASASEAEILVQLPGGNNLTRFTAPFVSDVVPAFVELKLGADESGNHAPAVVLTASVNGEAVTMVNPGTVVRFTAVGNDSDSADQAALDATWAATSGILAAGTSDFEKVWTAPDYFAVATITVEVKDPKNAAGKAQLPILVGIDNPSQVDSSRPTVALTADSETVTDSAAFNVTITFNEPVTGFELADISFTNGVLADFSTVTARKVFKVKVTPQAAGEFKVSVDENVAVDLSNNKNTASNIITVTNTLTPAKSSEKAITAFSFPALSVSGTINGNDIAVTVPFGTNVTTLVANFTASAKTTVKVGATVQVSGTTANNFSSAVIYKVSAEDGSTADYTVTVTVNQPTQITSANVTITAPVMGATPQDAAAVETATANADYTVTGLTWNEALTAGGKFKAGQAYTATVTLTSKNGKKFQAAAFTPTVAGSASVGNTTTSGSAIGNTVSFTVNYAATGALTVTGIAVTTQPTKLSYAEATDGTLALNGMVVTETNNDGSTNTVTFTDGTAAGYSANPANGTALTNAAHNGQPVTVTHTASSKTANTNSLAVAAIAEIAAAAVTITAPVLGATPQDAAAVEAATANADYTVTDLTWNEALTAGDKFKAGQAYTATVTLTSKNGKKFQAAAFTPTVAGSASVGNTTTTGSAIGNTVSFTVNYAATGALTVTGIAVTTQPTKLSYAEATDGTLALNGMVVTETNNDGSTNTVTFTDGTAAGYSANPANGTALTNASHNGYPVTVTHTASTQNANTSNLFVGGKVTHVAGGVSFKVSYAPAATFPTGSDNSGEQTVSQPFWIGETEVTYELWYAVRTWAVDAARAPNQYTFQNVGREGHDGIAGAAPTGAKNEPVTMVSWRDTVVWCNALSEMLSKDPVYRTGGDAIIRSSADADAAVVDAAVATANNGFRLPTEWEWELAARWKNDSSSTDGSILNNGRYWTPGSYASGATASTADADATKLAAWYSANSESKTQDVGKRPASGNHLGVHDMSGNVWEWCWDIYSGPSRVVRGGSWNNSAVNITVANRYYTSPNNQDSSIGFRVVRP